ncbi:LemA [Thermosipho melanesiensis]|uniref:LemA family protein n=2 Tax=Thermosipho melanesiensis TaxID=46541 RepID=A6LKY3_THEM4|nr:LemA family protein [Thermosipho melanesiensis]ABR30584.1 LemA family protein [Thermosipho melanesiensis BI429]APT73731.1 membrane protein [Thermosipho melanesiensis]OOC35668.1 LemA [Thermosipho melanesiensis]OOC38967.1 LemA [Thermosipho melanesiensis]OOC39115.1 LemA [Thermosipho melanesiensis]
MIGYIVLAIVLLFVLYLIGTYNSLVRLKKLIENAWSQIDVQLKRRHDLIPNLVNSVKGYMKYEQETLEKVMKARAAAISSKDINKRMESENELTGLLSRLLAVVENYPELKANENVNQLMNELRKTEDKIAYARQFYNDTVMKYNTKISVFPSNVVAKMFNFKGEPFFKIKETEKEVPTVSFE